MIANVLEVHDVHRDVREDASREVARQREEHAQEKSHRERAADPTEARRTRAPTAQLMEHGKRERRKPHTDRDGQEPAKKYFFADAARERHRPEETIAAARHERTERVVERAGPTRATKENARADERERRARRAEHERRDCAFEPADREPRRARENAATQRHRRTRTDEREHPYPTTTHARSDVHTGERMRATHRIGIARVGNARNWQRVIESRSVESLDSHSPTAERPRVLIVDDEKFIRDILADFLGMEGYARAHGRGRRGRADRAARGELRHRHQRFENAAHGRNRVARANRETAPNALTVIMTGFGTVETAIDAMKRGAYDYILKPFKVEEVIHVVQRGLEKQQLAAENIRLREAVVALQSERGDSSEPLAREVLRRSATPRSTSSAPTWSRRGSTTAKAVSSSARSS